MLTQERLKECLEYHPETGEFTRLGKLFGGAKRRSIGCLNSAGYPRLHVDGKSYLSSRLAFLYMVGYFPEEVDHKDRNPANNAWSNLRASDRSSNNCNKSFQSNNKVGLKGVSPRYGRYVSMICMRGEQKYLGIYDCPAAAHFAYMIAADKLHGEFARAA